MPVYDRKCQKCEWVTEFALEPVTDPRPPCPLCGAETMRYFAGHGPMVIPDTYTTPIVDSVMTKRKLIHESRSQRKQRMKDNKLQEFIRYSSGNESDKSSIHGPRWDAPRPGFLKHWEDYFQKLHPLTEDEKSRIVVTD